MWCKENDATLPLCLSAALGVDATTPQHSLGRSRVEQRRAFCFFPSLADTVFFVMHPSLLDCGIYRASALSSFLVCEVAYSTCVLVWVNEQSTCTSFPAEYESSLLLRRLQTPVRYHSYFAPSLIPLSGREYETLSPTAAQTHPVRGHGRTFGRHDHPIRKGE